MKKIINRAFVALAAVVLLMGCQSEGQKALSQIVGEWHYSGVEEGVQEDIWIAFSQDMTFELYQKMGDGLLRYRYTGTYEFDGTVLTGVYADYTPWADEYTVTSSANSLTLTSVSNPQYSMKYEREQIPEEVKTHYVPMTKGQSDGPAPVL